MLLVAKKILNRHWSSQPVKVDLNKKLDTKQKTANHGQTGRHWLADNSYFPCQRIFIFCLFEPLGINIGGLNSLLLGIQLLIQFYFDRLCLSFHSPCPRVFTSILHSIRFLDDCSSSLISRFCCCRRMKIHNFSPYLNTCQF